MLDSLLMFPEFFLVASILLILLVDMYLPTAKRIYTYRLTISLLSVLTVYQLLLMLPVTITVRMFSEHLVSDALTRSMQFLATLIVLCGLVLSRKALLPTNDSHKIAGEFFPLSLLALLGQLVMIKANSLLTLYLGIELMTLSLYALVAMRRDDPRAIEAATKYFILGALASGLLLYGISMIYGATGSILLQGVNQMIQSNQAMPSALVFGLVFIVIGLVFKLGLVPFHMWVPDVYEGAPLPATLMIATAPKIAAFVIILRVLFQSFFDLAKDWEQMILVVSLLSIGLGNVVAIAQSNIKRMFAYSAIAQLGFMLLGFSTALHNGGSPETFFQGFGGSLFYLLAYVIASVVAFGVLLYLSDNNQECHKISDLTGLNHRHPWLAFLLLLSMFSMAGIPPLIGFYAKFLILQSLIYSHFYFAAVLAILFSLVGAFYYLRVIKTMYFDASAESAVSAQRHLPSFFILSLAGTLLIVMGIFPDFLTRILFSILQISLLGNGG